MRYKWLFTVSALGLLAGGYAAWRSTARHPAQPPVFDPAPNPYAAGIYAEGIVESAQASGENINIYPEVAGTVVQIYVHEGEAVRKGAPLLLVDDSVQRAVVAQQESQAEAAKAMLEELRAQPRAETLNVAAAQVKAAEASLKTAKDSLEKQEAAHTLSPGAVSKDALDGAVNGEAVARTNLDVARAQYALIHAGAWSYDVTNQQRQQLALEKAYEASRALLAKYTLRAPRDGSVLAINTIQGAYVSPQGAYDAYTQGYDPVVSLADGGAYLQVRCYVDEILISKLPPADRIRAQMTIRGTDLHLPLVLERIQPLVSPKIQLSNQRQERVDVRVLPIVFRTERPKNATLFPGELVDVYIGQ